MYLLFLNMPVEHKVMRNQYCSEIHVTGKKAMNEDATEGRPLGFAYDFGVTVAMLSPCS
jgi:hypothetical protein